MIGELVAAEMQVIMERARAIDDPWPAVATYVTDRRDLQYREPAFTDALLMAYPNSAQLVALARAATRTTEALLRRAHAAGVLHPGFTTADLYYADVANGLALRALHPTRPDYNRRTRFFIASLARPDRYRPQQTATTS